MKKNLKKIFRVSYSPKLDLSLREIPLKAQQMAGKISISGVQTKLSLTLNQRKKRLDVSESGGEYILKPPLSVFKDTPLNENLCMDLAEIAGIETAIHTLIELKDKNLAYLVKRFDRKNKKKIPLEDFSQLLAEEDKYHGSYEKIGQRLRETSSAPGLDLQLFFERLIFFFIIGNGDAHLKNFSLLYHSQKDGRLSPAYDILSTKLIIPDEEDLALSMNGKKNKITFKDFEALRKNLKIPSQIGYQKILSKIPLLEERIKEDLLPLEEREKLLLIIKERVSRLS